MKEHAAVLVQLNVSRGGMPKLPIDGAMIRIDGVEGDWQKNRKYHGGPDRAICIYSQELYATLRDEGVDLANGALGENFTTVGIDLLKLAPGDQLRVGECLIEITEVRVPCKQLRKWSEKMPVLIEGRSGWMARVVREGRVKAGDPIGVLRRVD